MIPASSHPVWQKLLKGEKTIKSANVGINMLIFNSTLKYKKDPSPAHLRKLVTHAWEFFTKFEKNLQDELKQLIQ